MLTKRIIPCLDVKDGRTVKGVRFEGLRDAGDPVALAAQYARAGADELVFLDITATNEKRRTLVALVRAVAATLDIPFTVGGGIGAVADVELLLLNGTDKASINSAALHRPELIDELARRFGSQCLVVAVDARYSPEAGWQVYTRAGTHTRRAVGRDRCREVADRGCGEILLTSMSNDGTKDGFALDLTGAVSRAVPVPVVASGGAGRIQHFTDVFRQAHADAGLAASIFHFGEIGIRELKQTLRAEGIPVRL